MVSLLIFLGGDVAMRELQTFWNEVLALEPHFEYPASPITVYGPETEASESSATSHGRQETSRRQGRNSRQRYHENRPLTVPLPQTHRFRDLPCDIKDVMLLHHMSQHVSRATKTNARQRKAIMDQLMLDVNLSLVMLQTLKRKFSSFLTEAYKLVRVQKETGLGDQPKRLLLAADWWSFDETLVDAAQRQVASPSAALFNGVSSSEFRTTLEASAHAAAAVAVPTVPLPVPHRGRTGPKPPGYRGGNYNIADDSGSEDFDPDKASSRIRVPHRELDSILIEAVPHRPVSYFLRRVASTITDVQTEMRRHKDINRPPRKR
ncbi:hypothetical protein B0H63DRAFT_187776 [Podospora didyma]|uniref:Uncharacterized protein n=1 Tax=Podospora didyma TaxID=330526 RepID=A0AAE0TZW4_9PEZI|nr:hypothetical protein B0H63DRAFT_187776 [Podospora didyma]